jgi:hypothetical protein
MDDTELGEETKRKIAMEKVHGLLCRALFFSKYHTFFYLKLFRL